MVSDFSALNNLELEFLQDASFSQQTSPSWVAMNLPASVSMSWINDSDGAKDGGSFLRVHVSQPGGSVAQDVSRASPLFQGSYSLGLWLRAPLGSVPVSVSLALWALGGNEQVASTQAWVGTDWTFVTVGLDTTGGHG